MLSCKEVAERASALIDGELGVFDTLQMRFHLVLCKGCGAFIGQMRTTRDLTQVTPVADDPLDTDDGRMSAILSLLREGKQTGA